MAGLSRNPVEMAMLALAMNGKRTAKAGTTFSATGSMTSAVVATILVSLPKGAERFTG